MVRKLSVLAVFIFLALMLGAGEVQAYDLAKPTGAPLAAPLGDAFTYQGYLTDGGSPANGTYDFGFKLYDAASAGSQVGSLVVVDDATVSDGYFTVELDFGDVYHGTAYWLEIWVRPGASSGSYQQLLPRQSLTTVPYASYASQVAWSGLSGVPAGFADGDDGDTTYSAGAGLTLVGTQFSVDFAGSGGAATAARSDHDHWGQTWTGDGTGLTLSGNTGLNASGTTYGVYGQSESTSGRGVYGLANATSGETYGVSGESASLNGMGVYGSATNAAGANFGVWGQSASTSGTGVVGNATATSGLGIGVYGASASTAGRAVFGYNSATSGTNYGVWGESASTSGRGVYGWASATSGLNYGLFGQSSSTSGSGVFGNASATSGTTYGVYGSTNSPSGWAGYFYGKVYVSGDFIASGTKAFQIDHPLDPQNQYLYHYNVESSEVVNQYTGNVDLDENGVGWVTMPNWFQAINQDFRYQLTPIGDWAPLYIAQKIADNRFQIAGGEPGMEVSWMVTALRNDPFMQQNPHPVEEDKPPDEKGTYLYPQGYGQLQEMGLDYQRNQDTFDQQAPASP